VGVTHERRMGKSAVKRTQNGKTRGQLGLVSRWGKKIVTVTRKINVRHMVKEEDGSAWGSRKGAVRQTRKTVSGEHRYGRREENGRRDGRGSSGGKTRLGVEGKVQGTPSRKGNAKQATRGASVGKQIKYTKWDTVRIQGYTAKGGVVPKKGLLGIMKGHRPDQSSVLASKPGGVRVPNRNGCRLLSSEKATKGKAKVWKKKMSSTYEPRLTG